MKVSTKKKIKKLIPDLPPVRRYLKRSKVRRLREKLMPAVDAVAGERSADAKRELVKRYSEKWQSYAAELDGKLQAYYDRAPELRDRPDQEALREDVLFNAFAYGFTPDEYFFYGVGEKTREEKLGYISDLERYILTYSLNDVVDIEVFYDKYRTYERFRPFFQREAVSVKGQEDFAVFREFTDRHPVFVRKTVDMSRGYGVSLVDADASGQSREELFRSLIGQGKQILEELVVQSEEMKRFNPSSVNTIRCPVFRTAREIELAPCRFRCGQDGSFVDNAGSGGILAGVDRKTGIIETDGYDEFCNRFETHPQSGLRFKGYQIPDWELLRQTVTEMTERMPSMGYISWDMAHTDKGWVIIEGNGAGQFIGSQIVAQRGLKKEIEAQLEGVFSF